MRLQDRFNRCQGLRAGVCFATRRQIVVRGAFVAYRRCWHDDMPDRQRSIEDARAPAGDKFLTTQRDYFLKHATGERTAYTGVEDRQAFPIDIDLVDRVRAYFAPQVLDNACGVALRQLRDHILEEAGDGVLWNIYGLDDALWFENSLGRCIEFQYRVVLLHTLYPFLIIQ